MFTELKQLLRANQVFYKLFRRLRNYYYLWLYGLKNVHPTFYVAPGSHISRDLIAHEYGFISTDCMIGPKVELGPFVMLGPRVAIIGADHRFDVPGTPMIFSGRPQLLATNIEADVWVWLWCYYHEWCPGRTRYDHRSWRRCYARRTTLRNMGWGAGQKAP